MQTSNVALATIQTALRVIYPPRCLGCGETVGADFALCGPCRREVHVIGGLVCDGCGVPLAGAAGFGEHCDTCLASPPPWSQGRAALMYEGLGRKLVLAMKHGDRTDIARGMAPLMGMAARAMIQPDTVVVPVPLHWRRMFRRRYNQAALLAQGLARHRHLVCVPDALTRHGRHESLDGLGRAERFEALRGAITVHSQRADRIAGRHVLLVDDVMTSGATLGACTEALLASQVREVSVVTLARVAQTP
ncbi:ComF family protein [Donghicola mangrovi]|uniref:ComF family protein n=1 Tax=Donghicola mangrovi TaxID=2729614 RepID=A0A850Q7B2_9RHOB|nr:ComF family protein [Donghicola mangrovi]NVO22249.1 ComF family protein [Donghicola mangrovi]